MSGRARIHLAAALALALLPGPVLCDPPGAGNLGQGDDPGAAPATATASDTAPAQPRAGLTSEGAPHVTYRIVEGSEQPWVQGAAHFHPSLDTPLFTNHGSFWSAGGTCLGMCVITARWYWTYTHPIRSAPRPIGPGNAITSSLAFSRENNRPWPVYSENFSHFRLRAFTQRRSSTYPFADVERTFELCTGAHSQQRRGGGPIDNQFAEDGGGAAGRRARGRALNENIYGGQRGGYQAPQLAQLLTETITNAPEGDSPYSSGNPGRRGFGVFGFRVYRYAQTPPPEGTDMDFTQPRYDFTQEPGHGGHALFCYKFRQATVRAEGPGADGVEQPALVFRFWDPNIREEPNDPAGIQESSPADAENEGRNLLFYLQTAQRFTFHPDYQAYYRTRHRREGQARSLVQNDHVITEGLGFTAMGSSLREVNHPVDGALRETETDRRARAEETPWR